MRNSLRCCLDVLADEVHQDRIIGNAHWLTKSKTINSTSYEFHNIRICMYITEKHGYTFNHLSKGIRLDIKFNDIDEI